MPMQLVGLGLLVCAIGLLWISILLLFEIQLGKDQRFKVRIKFKAYDFATMLLSWVCFLTGGFGVICCIEIIVRLS